MEEGPPRKRLHPFLPRPPHLYSPELLRLSLHTEYFCFGRRRHSPTEHLASSSMQTVKDSISYTRASFQHRAPFRFLLGKAPFRRQFTRSLITAGLVYCLSCTPSLLTQLMAARLQKMSKESATAAFFYLLLSETAYYCYIYRKVTGTAAWK